MNAFATAPATSDDSTPSTADIRKRIAYFRIEKKNLSERKVRFQFCRKATLIEVYFYFYVNMRCIPTQQCVR
jgi:hypothetical protein